MTPQEFFGASAPAQGSAATAPVQAPPMPAPAAGGGMSAQEFFGAPGVSGAEVNAARGAAFGNQLAATQQPPLSKTGMAANIGAGAVEGGAAFGNILSDPFGNLIGKPLATAGMFIHDAVAPMFGGQRFSPEFRQQMLDDTVPQPGTRAMNAVADTIGAPRPENVVPGSDAQRLARKATTGAMLAGALGGVGAGGIAPAVITSGAGAGGAVTGDLLSQVVPEWAAPMADLTGNIVGGALTGGGMAGARAAFNSGVDAVRNAAAPFSEAGRQRLAAQKIAQSASDLPAVRQSLDNPQEIVPGSAPTTYQATGDQGLGNLERAVAKNAPDQFLQRQADQNAARVGQIENLAPASADPAAVGQSFRRQLDYLTEQGNAMAENGRQRVQQAVSQTGTPTTAQDAGAVIRGAVADQYAPQIAAADQAVSGAAAQAQGAVDAMGGALRGGEAGTDLQARGAAMRSVLDAANQAAKARESRLWQAIDPDGTLAVDMTPIRARAQSMMGSMPANAAPLEGAEAGVFQTAASLPNVQPFSELTALRERITSAMRNELSTNGRTPAYGRLSQLLDSVHGAMQAGVEQAAENTPELFNRLSDHAGDVRTQSEVVRSANQGQYGQQVPGAQPGSGAGAVPGAGGAAGNAAGRLGIGYGDQGVAPGYRGRAPESLIDFLIAKGGVQDQGGDLAGMGADAIHHRAAGRLVNPRGLSLDYAREAAEEAGFLRPGSSVNDLLDAVNEHVSGRPQYRISDQAEGVMRRQADADQGRYASQRFDAISSVEDQSDAMGFKLTDGERQHAADLMMQGLHPEDAVRQALSSTEYSALERNAQALAFGREGVPPSAQQGALPEMGGGTRLTANFDEAAKARYDAARAATAERHSTFTNAPGVGEVLRPGRTASEFRMAESSVPAALFARGKAAAERMQAALKASGNDPKLVEELSDYAARSLRSAAEKPDGTLDPTKYTNWAAAHREALSALPELSNRFGTAAAASRALIDAQAQRALLDAQYPIKPGWADAEVAARFFKPGPVGRASVEDFMRAVGGNDRAVRALKDYAADSLQQAAMNPDGTINSNKLQLWMQRHESALSAFPELRDKFSTVGKAQAEVDASLAAHAQAVRDYQRSAASHFLGGADPVQRVGAILRSQSAESTMAELARLTKHDAAARAGLKRAVVEFIQQELRSNTLAGGERLIKSDTFQMFIRRSGGALAQIFRPEEVKAMRDVAEDLQRANRSIAGTKLPGGSNTAQDLAAGEKHGVGGGHGAQPLNVLLMAEAGGEALHHIVGAKARIAGLILAPLVNAMRQSRMAKVDQLVTEAMLNPKLAKQLLSNVPSEGAARMRVPVMTSLIRGSALSAMARINGAPSGEPASDRIDIGPYADPDYRGGR